MTAQKRSNHISDNQCLHTRRVCPWSLLVIVLLTATLTACGDTSPRSVASLESKLVLLPRPQELTLTGGWYKGSLDDIIDEQSPTSVGDNDYELWGYPDESYCLTVTQDEIRIKAADKVGFLRGRQTLEQLRESAGGRIPTCVIRDWPAFKLRGFMHDTGRSFISIDELKKEIKLLAQFKVNTFHWHLTENQAWRFEVKAFPQLTADSSMTRFPGCFYTQEECRSLESFAAELGVILIPEIDMPGHSAAFERAMGHSMSSPQGQEETKIILGELLETFPLAPYIHIGADETSVKPEFLDSMAAVIRRGGRKVITWNPAGTDISPSFCDMTQLWATHGRAVEGIPAIDCRYNYINHFDLFADVVGIYKSSIYYAAQGSPALAGTITATWNDRLLTDERDIIRQNNFYANVLATAERAWCGGGEQYIEQGGTVLPNSGKEYEAFADWERRFLFHKAHTLADEPIPYVRQTDVRWRITDPFPNDGDKEVAFPPEQQLQKSYDYDGQTFATHTRAGAGIYLRHTWGDNVPSGYAGGDMGTTAYAWTFIHSPKEQDAGALIEFQNYGRSERDLAPDEGCWDRKGSRIWLNDTELVPPHWDNTGLAIHHEMPLRNENCTARPPYPIHLHKGWNKVFMKLPFNPDNGVRLSKWMFTFVVTTPNGRNALDGIVYDPDVKINEK